MPKSILNSNKSFTEIDSMCIANNINVTYFCSPFCSNLKSNGYIDKLKSKISNFEDFSSAVTNDSLFENCNHLNKAGAEVFSSILVKRFGL